MHSINIRRSDLTACPLHICSRPANIIQGVKLTPVPSPFPPPFPPPPPPSLGFACCAAFPFADGCTADCPVASIFLISSARVMYSRTCSQQSIGKAVRTVKQVSHT